MACQNNCTASIRIKRLEDGFDFGCCYTPALIVSTPFDQMHVVAVRDGARDRWRVTLRVPNLRRLHHQNIHERHALAPLSRFFSTAPYLTSAWHCLCCAMAQKRWIKRC